MITTLLVDENPSFTKDLEYLLNDYCPQIDIVSIAYCYPEAFKAIEHTRPDLVFIDWAIAFNFEKSIFQFKNLEFETIFLFDKGESEFFKKQLKSHFFLHKPIEFRDLVLSVRQVETMIALKKTRKQNNFLLREILRDITPNDVFPIPTIEGIEFLKVGEILRCQGLQKYTRVITLGKSDIISSYSIGQFAEILENFGFFLTHKSHLVNLRHMRKFLSEGTLIMRDGSMVPVSRRKKQIFLDRVNVFK